MVCVRQINLQKSKTASELLMRYIARSKHDILLLIQEPYLYKGRIPGLPHTYISLGSKDKPRAMLLAPKHYPLFLVEEMSDRDTATILFKDSSFEMYFISLYCDGLLPTISTLVTKLADFLEAKDAAAVFGLDSNAHSVLYSDIEESDLRGQRIEEFIMGYDLKLLNKAPFWPTYVSTRFQSCIDLSLVRKNSFKKHVTKWNVLKDHTFSDHKYIEFYVELTKVPPPQQKSVDWPRFSDVVQQELQSGVVSHEYYTQLRVEREAINLTNCFTKALQLCTFQRPVKARQQKWWCGDLTALKKECVTLWRKMQNNPSLANRAAYNAKLKDLRYSIRRAKRESWKSHCTNVGNAKDMSFLTKTLKGRANSQIGSIKKEDGTYTCSPIETLSCLMSEHFPGSVPLHCSKNESEVSEIGICLPTTFHHSQTRGRSLNSPSPSERRARDKTPRCGKICSKDSLKESFVTEETVRAVFNSFGPDKMGGIDEIKPKALQNLPDVAVKRLTMLFKAILEIGFTPKIWRESKVVFIPKQGKTDYTDSRAWRPISLSTFLIKSVEKLVLWQLDELSLINNSLSKDQHAFRAGYSTESALSDFVDDVESAITRHQYALGVFLDIKGAFDNCQHTAIVEQMKSKHFPRKLVDWYEQYLRNREAHSTLKGHTCSIRVTTGTPQGGILSPLAWNLVFEKFIDTMSHSSVKTRCFADDACLLIKGICPTTMAELMQSALNQAINWGLNNSLTFVPSKTVAVFFHRKRRFKAPKLLTVSDQPIVYSKVAKYLGVFLDTSLNFTYHIQNKVKQAKRLVMSIRNAVGSNWGPVPRALKWAYSGIVLPIVGYGSFLFARMCKKQSILKKLNSLNRLMALTMMHVRKSTPTSGLEIILGLPPLAIKLEEIALNAILRILPHNRTRWDGVGNTANGHLRWGLDKIRAHGITQTAFDLTKARNLNKSYVVDLDFKSGLPTTNDPVSCFTDGSKIANGNTGYGFGIVQNEEIISHGNGQLSIENSVFQGEIMGINKACDALYEVDSLSCTIFCDSQSAIKALASPTVKSKAVQNCIEKLNFLGNQKVVTIKWVKAHNSHKFNDFADEMAKKGTKNTANRVDIPPPNSWAKEILAQKMIREWGQHWTSLNEARQTKIWFARPNKALSGNITQLNRSDLGLFVQMVTGHNRLNYHESIVNQKPTEASCRFCMEAPESFWHLIGECDALWNQRCTSFETLNLDNPPKWKINQVLKFLRISKMAKLNERSEQISSADDSASANF